MRDVRGYVAAAVAAGGILTSVAAAEAQSAQPETDFNESAERARASLRSGSWGEVLGQASKRFGLFNNCEPVTLKRPLVLWELQLDPGVTVDGTVRRGSTTWSIRRMTETRFRNAGVLNEQGRGVGWFELEMSGLPPDFHATATFEKAVIDLASGEVGIRGMWTTRVFAGRGGWTSSPPEAVASMMVDGFLTDYLAVNQDACAERRAR